MSQELMELGAYDMAASYYRRAIRLLPNQPMFHSSLDVAYQRLGKDRAARRARESALSLEQRRHSQGSIPEPGPGSGCTAPGMVDGSSDMLSGVKGGGRASKVRVVAYC